MKRILFPVILVLNLFSHNAFATHAYRSEVCKSKTHNLNYNGNYPMGGFYGISLAGSNDEEVKALPLFDSETPNSLEDADVIFSETSSKVIKKSEPSHDCDFDHEEWTSEKTVVINLINSEASNSLGLKQGDTLSLVCEESTDYPNGNNCN